MSIFKRLSDINVADFLGFIELKDAIKNPKEACLTALKASKNNDPLLLASIFLTEENYALICKNQALKDNLPSFTLGKYYDYYYPVREFYLAPPKSFNNLLKIHTVYVENCWGGKSSEDFFFNYLKELQDMNSSWWVEAEDILALRSEMRGELDKTLFYMGKGSHHDIFKGDKNGKPEHVVVGKSELYAA